MSSEFAVRVEGLSKCYRLYERPVDRLKQMLRLGKTSNAREFWALRDVSFEVMPGEVVGIIGRNGSGKSTLLQLICGTLTPTVGQVEVKGRIAALLELGAGFNPEFTGRENVFLSATVLGLTPAEIAACFEDIVEFSGIRDFIDQPVKTYSSGMYVRLAFSVAISIDPDILVIDEALSVGDGEFSRKSFDRIMALKEAGKTILFCSHSMYQVEAICDRTLWINQGELKVIGTPAQAIVAYNTFVNGQPNKGQGSSGLVSAAPGTAAIAKVVVAANGVEGHELLVVSGKTTVVVTVEFASDPALPAPSVAVMITDAAHNPITSAGTRNDGLTIDRDATGNGKISIVFEAIPLLKGVYWLYAFLMCENGVHFYEYANMVAQLNITQDGLEMGVVSVPHYWE